MPGQPIAIGVDIGGSHISCAAVHIGRGQLLPATATREKVSHDAPAADIFAAWARALNAVIGQAEAGSLAGIGFAIPGPFEYRNGISRMEHKFLNIYGISIPHALQPLLHTPGPAPMRFLNDAAAFTVGEAWLGRGKNHRKVLAITLGTGFGSAFTDEGVPVVEREDVPPEGCLWHIPYRDKTAEEYFNTHWLVSSFAEKTGRQLPGAREIADLAQAGDHAALELFRQYGANMAGFLAPWLRRFKAGIVVIGGNISGAYSLFGPALKEGLEAEKVKVELSISKLMENAAMIGAARLLDDGFWEKVRHHLPSI